MWSGHGKDVIAIDGRDTELHGHEKNRWADMRRIVGRLTLVARAHGEEAGVRAREELVLAIHLHRGGFVFEAHRLLYHSA